MARAGEGDSGEVGAAASASVAGEEGLTPPPPAAAPKGAVPLPAPAGQIQQWHGLTAPLPIHLSTWGPFPTAPRHLLTCWCSPRSGGGRLCSNEGCEAAEASP